MDSEFVAKSLKLNHMVGQALVEFSNVTSDSRKVLPGSLFVALSGEKLNGHAFISDAVEKGAAGILGEEKFLKKQSENQALGKTIFFPVSDSLVAYRTLAQEWRKRFDIPVVAVAGSVGKTTTKEFLAALLRGKWKNILKTEASQNGFVGIPMTLLELNSGHEVAVVEVGIDDIGAMEKHIPVICPTMAILTAIGPEHLEQLQDVPTVAREEGLAFSMVSKDGGSIVVFLDDPWIKPHFEKTPENQRWGYTLKTSSKTSLKKNPNILTGFFSQGAPELLCVQFPDGQEAQFPLPLAGLHNVSNLLGAIAVANALGLSPAEMQAGLKSFRAAAGRSEVFTLDSGALVICDYYNANPQSMAAGLVMLSEKAKTAPSRSTRWACLADMLELGAEEERFHRELALSLIQAGIENALLFGPRMLWLKDELEKKNFRGLLRHFSTRRELANFLTSNLEPQSTVLIKGSRSMQMEEVWKILQTSKLAIKRH